MMAESNENVNDLWRKCSRLLRKIWPRQENREAYDIAFAHQTLGMDMVLQKKTRVAFQGEPRAFSEAAAFQLLSDSITTAIPKSASTCAARVAIDIATSMAGERKRLARP